MNTTFAPEEKVEGVGTCSHCGNSTAYNTPSLDPEGKLWCDNCVDNDRSNTLFSHIDQHKINGKFIPKGGYSINGVVVWKDLSIWVNGGRHSVKLTEEEKKLSPLRILDIIDREYNQQKIIRCTGCGEKMKVNEVAGYPLFAGVACPTCWQKHKEHLDNQRRMGHVCRMCGQPYSNCCC